MGCGHLVLHCYFAMIRLRKVRVETLRDGLSCVSQAVQSESRWDACFCHYAALQQCELLPDQARHLELITFASCLSDHARCVPELSVRTSVPETSQWTTHARYALKLSCLAEHASSVKGLHLLT